MVLVDTSVWIDHFRNNNDQLVYLLNENDVYCHELVIGELACGNLKNRVEILTALQTLPKALNVEHEEVLLFIEKHKIMGKGLGYIDVNILVSSITTGIQLWTLDKRLSEYAKTFDIQYK